MDNRRRTDAQRVPAADAPEPARRPPDRRRTAEPAPPTDTVSNEQKRGLPSGELSRRERQVLRLLAKGKTDQEIADALGVSYRTVTTHVARVFAKLGVRSRAAAAAEAVRRDLA